MKVLAIVHDDDSGPGVFLDVVSEEGVTLDTWVPTKDAQAPADLSGYDALMIFGGAAHPSQIKDLSWMAAEVALLKRALKQRKPMLGVCLGAQLIAEAAGTRTRRAAIPEIGWYEVKLTKAAETDPLFADLPAELISARRADSFAVKRSFEALEWHTYEVPLPASATALAQSDTCLQAYRLGANVWGVQSHPEVTPEDYTHWLSSGETDPSWLLLGLDRDDLQHEADEKLERFNELGRTLARRFLHAAANQN